MEHLLAFVCLVVGAAIAQAAAPAGPPRFDRVVIDADMPGGYQVETADVNDDGRLDIVALGDGVCAWYENPLWTKRIVTTAKQSPGIISTATADINGDGKAEIAVAYEFEMNDPKKGKLLLASQDGETWRTKPIGDIGSIHRIRWADCDGDGRLELVIAPIFGSLAKPPAFQAQGARVALVRPDRDRPLEKFTVETLEPELPVMHAFEVVDFNRDGRADILTASNLGVSLLSLSADPSGTAPRVSVLSPGKAGPPPKRGSSEIHLGKLADGRRFLATIEPWHGTDVVVRRETRAGGAEFGPAETLDDSLTDGHALWVADVNGDGNDEVFAGHRGKDHRVSLYMIKNGKWERTVLDRGVAAQDLRGGDFNGDGAPDIAAIGGSTHNVVAYLTRKTD